MWAGDWIDISGSQHWLEPYNCHSHGNRRISAELLICYSDMVVDWYFLWSTFTGVVSVIDLSVCLIDLSVCGRPDNRSPVVVRASTASSIYIVTLLFAIYVYSVRFIHLRVSNPGLR